MPVVTHLAGAAVLPARIPVHDLNRADHARRSIASGKPGAVQQFVVAWLEQHMPDRYRVRAQENVEFGIGYTVKARIDITIEDAASSRAVYVLDTKYKKPDQPASETSSKSLHTRRPKTAPVPR